MTLAFLRLCSWCHFKDFFFFSFCSLRNTYLGCVFGECILIQSEHFREREKKEGKKLIGQMEEKRKKGLKLKEERPMLR